MTRWQILDNCVIWYKLSSWELIKLDANFKLWTQVRAIKNLLEVARSRGLHGVPDVTNWPVNKIYHIPPQEDGYVLILYIINFTHDGFYIPMTISLLYIFSDAHVPSLLWSILSSGTASAYREASTRSACRINHNSVVKTITYKFSQI